MADAVQPLADGEVVGFGDARGGVNAVEQGLPGVAGGYPVAVGALGDLVIGPGEGASCCPADEGPGLPVQALALVLLLLGGGFLWPRSHHGQPGQAEARGDVLVRVAPVQVGLSQASSQASAFRRGPCPGIYPGQERAGTGYPPAGRYRNAAAGPPKGMMTPSTSRKEQGSGQRVRHGVTIPARSCLPGRCGRLAVIPHDGGRIGKGPAGRLGACRRQVSQARNRSPSLQRSDPTVTDVAHGHRTRKSLQLVPRQTTLPWSREIALSKIWLGE